MRATLATLFLIPIAAAAGWAAHSSELDGLVKVDEETHYGWVVTSGPYEGQVTDVQYILKTKPEDRPPAEFRRITCAGYAPAPGVTTLADRVARVCRAVTVDEAEVRRALG